ncbi:hypothetical protein DFH06DRAFT_1123329 [Mycena polygramma]|nr:hypothetical protein DFH06DRAFT_1123329 [Mycena polygramma]
MEKEEKESEDCMRLSCHREESNLRLPRNTFVAAVFVGDDLRGQQWLQRVVTMGGSEMDKADLTKKKVRACAMPSEGVGPPYPVTTQEIGRIVCAGDLRGQRLLQINATADEAFSGKRVRQEDGAEASVDEQELRRRQLMHKAGKGVRFWIFNGSLPPCALTGADFDEKMRVKSKSLTATLIRSAIRRKEEQTLVLISNHHH